VGPARWNRSVSILWIVRSSVGLHKGTPPSRDHFGLNSEGLGTAGRVRVAPTGGKMASQR
jgi:hypothetical protein